MAFTSHNLCLELLDFRDLEHICLYLAIYFDLDAQGHFAVKVGYCRTLTFDKGLVENLLVTVEILYFAE